MIHAIFGCQVKPTNLQGLMPPNQDCEPV